jgi:hypothetical protein
MSAGTTRTADQVTVSIARDPALVRTVRLVAAAVARRARLDEELVEEVRLAVGEACAILMAPSPSSSKPATEPVTVALAINGRLRVAVMTEVSGQPNEANLADLDDRLSTGHCAK